MTTALTSKIQALLNKAEATTNEAEREAFNAKAFELMTKHAIERSQLPGADNVETREGSVTTVDIPSGSYAHPWTNLLMAIARANGCELVRTSYSEWGKNWGDPDRKFRRLHIFGAGDTPLQVAALYTSLQIQCVSQSKLIKGFDGAATRRERVGFIRGFADVIGKRLQEQTKLIDEASGGSLLPALRTDKQIALATRDVEFPSLRAGRGSYAQGGNRGREAGKAAGRSADLGGARIGNSARGELR